MWEEYPAYDHNGNMVEKRNLEGTTRYAYDANNQLVEVSYPGAGGLLSEKFGYDRAGNRLTREKRTVDSIIMETYHHDNCNRIKELNRRTYEPDGVTPKLKKSPAKIIDPIIVQKLNDGGYEIVNGHHRWAAAKKTGLKKVPVRIKNYSNGK